MYVVRAYLCLYDFHFLSIAHCLQAFSCLLSLLPIAYFAPIFPHIHYVIICNSSLCAINCLRCSLRMTSLCLAVQLANRASIMAKRVLLPPISTMVFIGTTASGFLYTKTGGSLNRCRPLRFFRFAALFPKLILIQPCIDAARSDELRVRAPFGDAIPR